jgi:hypothetical protein
MPSEHPKLRFIIPVSLWRKKNARETSNNNKPSNDNKNKRSYVQEIIRFNLMSRDEFLMEFREPPIEHPDQDLEFKLYCFN